MFLIKAIPIARGVGTDMLSYWSPAAALPGSVIRVPLRKRTVGAIVISSEHAAESKSEIKSADFEIKKIAKPNAQSIISQEFFAAAQETARYHAASIGSALFECVPAPILAEYEKLPAAPALKKRSKPRESYVLQKSEDDRYGHYKSLVRERFARKESVFMTMPSAEDIRIACSYFEKGIERYTYTFHGGLSKTELAKRWKAALEDEHPIVIVATGGFLSLPRADIGLIILEHESARGYKAQSRPFIDYRFLAERYARAIGADLIFGDSCLRIETLWREQEGIGSEQLVEYAPLSMRSLATARDTLVDMKKYKNPHHDIRIISNELYALIKKAREDNGHIFIFAGRKGLAPQTICSDCETVLTCDHCSAPMVLHGAKPDPADAPRDAQGAARNGPDKNRFFLCNRCGHKSDAFTKCRTCGSWRLKTLGIGTERIEQELAATLPEAGMSDVKIFRLDKIAAPTHKMASEIVERWYSSPGSILVGTELALMYLDRPIDYCAVGSLDALFSIPDFRINEKVFSIVLKLRSIAQKHFLLQTRSPEAPVLSQGVKGNIIDFYREEIESRKQFGFPPYSIFIKVSYAGKKEDVLAAMDRLQIALAGWQVDVFPAFVATVRAEYVMHALIKVPRKDWPNPELGDRLRGLSPSYAINVDPESIL